MKRSEFLKLSAQGMVTTAFVAFPKKAPAQTIPGKELVFAKKFSSDETKKHFSIRCTINDKYAKGSIMKLEIGQADDIYDDPKVHSAINFKVKKVIDYNSAGYALVKIKRSGNPKTQGDYRPSPALAALVKAKFVMVKEEEIIIKQKKKHDGYTIPKYVADSGGGCYLTTACTQYKGLADDCAELQTLRTFRDKFVRQQEDGEATVSQYYDLAPSIVDAIYAREDQDTILAFIYDRLVAPSMDLIAKGEDRLAMEYYKEFSWELDRRLSVA